MTKAEKVRNFKRIAPKRVGDIIRALRKLENLSNESYYYYDSNDLARMFETIEAQLKITKEVLQGIKKGEFNL